MKKKKMKKKKVLWVLSAALVGLAISFESEERMNRIPFTGGGDPEVLIERFTRWQSQKSPSEVVLAVRRWDAFSPRLLGQAHLDLLQGKLRLNLTHGLPQGVKIWLVRRETGQAKLAGELAAGQREWVGEIGSPAFAVDELALARDEAEALAHPLAVAKPSLFQKLYYAQWSGRIRLATWPKEEAPKWVALLPKPALADAPSPEAGLEALVAEGRRLFHEETFGGNGRTCGTCHREDNNFTLDPKYIASLPPTDPLFVHERNPSLAGLEHPQLLRQLALVQTNVDGFDKPPVLRSVPHLLSLVTSIAAEVEDQGRIAQSTGWSGDGAPGDGSLRMFAVGAIRQHLTKSLARVEGMDFRLPTEAELDALEAYMLSLGRPQDPDLKRMVFMNPIVERGKKLFDTKQNPVRGGQVVFGETANCNGCHMNGGGLSSTTFANPIRDTGIENQPDQPHRLLDPNVAFDGGFGTQPRQCGPDLAHPCYGDGRFSTPTAIEAADTPPYFHNNSVNTIEQVVAAYTGPTFNNSPGALTSSGANRQIILDGSQMTAVALFLRAINVVENIDSSNRMDERAMRLGRAQGKKQIKLALADTEDAVEVLEGAVYNVYPEALKKLKRALSLEQEALDTNSLSRRNELLQRAMARKREARDLIVVVR